MDGTAISGTQVEIWNRICVFLPINRVISLNRPDPSHLHFFVHQCVINGVRQALTWPLALQRKVQRGFTLSDSCPKCLSPPRMWLELRQQAGIVSIVDAKSWSKMIKAGFNSSSLLGSGKTLAFLLPAFCNMSPACKQLDGRSLAGYLGVYLEHFLLLCMF